MKDGRKIRVRDIVVKEFPFDQYLDETVEKTEVVVHRHMAEGVWVMNNALILRNPRKLPVGAESFPLDTAWVCQERELRR